MKLGFALSPGGLMLPFHLGALECLEDLKVLKAGETPVAGSSAGAIAAMAHGCGLSKKRILQATIDVSDQAAALGGARGRLLPLLEQQMKLLVGDDEFDYLVQSSSSSSSGSSSTPIGIAYREIFLQRQNVLQSTFESRQDLFQAVGNSCMFPFFATNFPCRWDRRNGNNLLDSRLVVDGYFSVPRERFGCPDFDYAFAEETSGNEEAIPSTIDRGDGSESKSSTAKDNSDEQRRKNHPLHVDRTIAISVFPKSTIGMTAFDDDDVIAPPPPPSLSSSEEQEGSITSLENLFRIATQASSKEDLTQIYELGYQSAQDWYHRDKIRQQHTSIESMLP